MPPRKKKPLPKPDHAPAVTPSAPQTASSSAAPAEVTPTNSSPAPARAWQPDPFVLMAVSLGSERTSPRMRLHRSNRLNQMAIQFDERPEQPYRTRLREDGWRWREDEGVWTKQLDRERRATGQLHAERLFAEIGNAIRAELGLEPQRDVGS